jgi:hypothetical protein
MSRLNVVCVGFLLSGCVETSQPVAQKPADPPKPAEIGEFDQGAGKEVVTLDAKVSNPITGPVEILKTLQVKMPTLQIEQALNFFNANEGRFPKSHDEFMTQVIAPNNIRLPVLPSGLDYQYDVDGHRLVIVNTADGKTVE